MVRRSANPFYPTRLIFKEEKHIDDDVKKKQERNSNTFEGSLTDSVCIKPAVVVLSCMEAPIKENCS